MRKVVKDQPQCHQSNRRRLEFAVFEPPERISQILPRVLRRTHKQTAHRQRRSAK